MKVTNALLSIIVFAEASELGATAPGDWLRTGLLGGVLAWLMWIRLPAEDKKFKEMMTDKDGQLKAYIETKDKQIEQLIERHLTAEKMQRNDYREALQAVVAHCDAETERYRLENKELRELVFAKEGKKT